MKLISFQASDRVRLGIKTENGIVDVCSTAEKAGLSAPNTMEDVIAAGQSGLDQLHQVLSQADETLEESTIQYAPVVQNPIKIICSGANYRAHVAEANLAIPEFPIYFPKYQNSLAAHNEEIVPPAITEQVDYEVEMVVVMGQQARNVTKEEALDYVFGYATGNDFSARDLQFRGVQWMYGKAIDQFAPIGPYLVTADEVPNPQNLDLKCWVNGDLRQNSNTEKMIFPIAELISDLSQAMTLEAGDVIFTGTPEGVIVGMEEKKWLQPGDEIVCEVEGLGRLVNRLAPR
ncbi:FAA hydrolase family protein [Peribacillus cavernae]|uniref:FAA hydrolase family protein n=1 Tax=Peribacillus cavernae TaxID=1674310 RepID=A0A3S0VEJ9_9BACI|nr:fumarylacetoacetate hydrolase family protein [Peribacillus cavernae]MDQ0219780.1 2-keto-4-pentenoate hydratase/2-oxohepta-3-ene-1,7-dioic acid hydratase in catechol pathway [Peribacillus cavernae]RUQ25195.1 FAA hydrolase family protein [Peribacillus cavernae]